MRGAPLPPAGAYLWKVFIRLHARRGSGGMGVGPILWGDIDAFCRLSGFRLTPWEVEQIEALDSLFLVECAKRTKEKPAKG